jgi:mannose-6-phosphate isomerase-like protein (cupin superfamily)
MTSVHALEDMQSSPTAALFEGRKRAEVDISCFVVSSDKVGRGPKLHKHPYAEVFVVLEGEATFTAGDEEHVITGGHIVVVPPETPHKFVNTGDDRLRMVTVHDNGDLVQTDLED